MSIGPAWLVVILGCSPVTASSASSWAPSSQELSHSTTSWRNIGSRTSCSLRTSMSVTLMFRCTNVSLSEPTNPLSAGAISKSLYNMIKSVVRKYLYNTCSIVE